MNPVDINKYICIYGNQAILAFPGQFKHIYIATFTNAHTQKLILTNYIYAGYTWCGGGDAIVIAIRKQQEVVKAWLLL